MIRKLVLLLAVACFAVPRLFAADSMTVAPMPHLRISLVTCGPGAEEVYEVFGHSAVRLVDSGRHTDNVYNYGTFEYGPNFEMQFMRGKLLYSLAVYPFSEFMQEYVQAGRSVNEQVLNISDSQKLFIASFLDENYEPQNRYYKYDFFFDNCATRIRDIFPQALGKGFAFGNALPANSKLTFRDIINQYFRTRLWERMGVNILLGSKIDQKMSNEDVMFLPDFLEKGIAGATLNGKNISAGSAQLLAATHSLHPMFNWPFLLSVLLAALTIAGLSVPQLRRLGQVMQAFMLAITGLLGVVILLMWFGTDHQACRDNFNLLWALPTNLIAAFGKGKGRGRYSLIAIALVFLSLVLHIIGVQRLLLLEFSPILLSLLYIYTSIYRKSKTLS